MSRGFNHGMQLTLFICTNHFHGSDSEKSSPVSEPKSFVQPESFTEPITQPVAEYSTSARLFEWDRATDAREKLYSSSRIFFIYLRRSE